MKIQKHADFNFRSLGQVEVMQSTVPDAGRGVFALRDFAINDVIMEYGGILYHSNDTEYVPTNKFYVLDMNAGWLY